ncbi:MAG: hypothetical protein JHD16_03775 [Solirubrobacteraceae bacterium]|nr:hypothetical protein [Solirubrobacteraceae bacterium]
MSCRTQSAHRPMRAALSAVLVALAAGLAPSPASAAQRVETVDVPSSKGYIDLAQTRLNKATKLQANVLLPDGYDDQPGKAWPVMYLLAGVGDNMGAWLDPKKGDARKVLKDFPGIVVMPESGRGYFTDWWRGGSRVGTRWERYYFEELIPAMESRYRIKPGRQHHAIGGLSMGGYGGLLYVGQFPSYFGNAFSLSGLLDLQSSEVVSVLPVDIGSPFTRIWGSPKGPYATSHNPVKMVSNNLGSRVYLSAGDGNASMRVPFNFAAWTSGSVAERSVRVQSLRYAAKAREAGVDVTYSGVSGVHDWPYWRMAFPRLLNWGVFNAPSVPDAAANTSWTYRTMAPQGNAWGYGYKFASAPSAEIVTFTRSGQTLSGVGSGTVTITPGAADADASGNGTKPQCAFTVTLPFTHTLPAGC